MGTRAVMDTILAEMIPGVEGFKNRLTAAVDKRMLTVEQRNIISTAIEAGHAASHRGFRPSVDQLNDVLDIVEHTLHERYVLTETTQRLDGYVPPRRKVGRDDHGT